MALRNVCIRVVVMALLPFTVGPVQGIDWPQFMCNAQHNGDAREEQLDPPLHLNAQVRLDDAVLSSPVIVAGRIYVVDQMGTAYGIELKTGLIAWKTAPEDSKTFGSNTSSPCVAKGRVFYGTIAGNLHILSAGNGTLIRSIKYDWPIMDAITYTNDSVYFQTLNGVVHCLDLDGHTRWVWDQYTLTRESEITNGQPPRTGKILWRTNEAYASQTGTPSYKDGRIYLPGAYKLPISCLSAQNGEIIWQQESIVDRWHVEICALGPDYFTVNNKYEGGAWRWNLTDGSIVGSLDNPVQLCGSSHGCGAVVLASEGYALSATLEGIFAVNCETGKVIWKSPGFASWACPHPIAANGRMFYCPQVNDMLYCFEPASSP